MLTNHKNFHLTKIPDKTKHAIFLKSPKNHVFESFLTVFGHFYTIFPKKSGSVTHNYIWAPNTMLSFTKNERANS